MSTLEEHIDVRLLVKWLGIDGAKAGLEKSKLCTIPVLKELATELGIDVSSKPKREELISDVIRIAGRRIERPLEELYRMPHEELVQYFERVGVEAHELLDLLKDLQLDPGKEGRRNLIEFVAQELAETGRFMRIASQGGNRDASATVARP